MSPAQTTNQKKNANPVAPPDRCSSPPGGSYQNQEQNPHLMCRLTVGVGPPSGFWKKNPETSIKQCKT